MRPRLHVSLLTAALLSGCGLWDPDYEPDPDVQLRELLGSLDGSGEEAADGIDRERVRFAIEALATRHPGHVPSQIAAGAFALDGGEPQRAEGFVSRALSLAPDNIEARTMRVRIAVADGSLGLARKLVDDGLQLRPDAAALYESSAWLYQMEGQADDALRALDAAEALDAPLWRLSYHRGLVEEQRGQLLVAKEHYQAALDARSDFVAAQRRLRGLEASQRMSTGR